MAEIAGDLRTAAATRTLEAMPTPPVPGELDLTSCDREPIHIPGSIQPHGFLLVLDRAGRVTVSSSNAGDFLHRPLHSIFGETLPGLLGQTGHRILSEFGSQPLGSQPLGYQPLARPAAEDSRPFASRLLASRLLASIDIPAADGPSARFEVVASQATVSDAPATIFEFEQSLEPVDIDALNARLYNFVASIRRLESTESICQAAVEEIHTLSRCDRVVLYRFDEQGHGLVLAEVRAHDRFESYLGLRFPASDVPVQARRMYLQNRVRIIPNVDYEPSPLLAAGPVAGTADAPRQAPEIDLSHCILRSVSPIHRQYMRNMGTACSMSMSIIIDGKLWGLVSCHHHSARYVPLRLRSACDFIMQIVASQIEAHTSSLRLQRALVAKGVQGRLLASMAAADNYMDGLIQSPETLQALTNASGAALVVGSTARLFGVTPSESQVLQLVDWLSLRGHDSSPSSSPGTMHDSGKDELFSTSQLSSVYPRGESFAAQGSGVIAITVSRLHNTHVLWFRQELVQTVRWAGNPQKPAEPASSASNGIVHPRHSFDEWSQIVRGCAQPWADEEVEAAAEFRAAVLQIVLRRAEELAELAAGLQVANEELEAFSYSVSHDLRAPFRHISGFSEMLKEEEGERMSPRGQHYLATIMDSARFAGLLVDSLLEFSRFARAEVAMVPIHMEGLADREWEAVQYDEALRPVDFSRGPLPRVLGDAQLLRQVLRNLFSNAAKYSGKQPDPRIRMECRTEGSEYIFSIADNGVGFDQQYASKLFGVFQRLHRVEDFEGTGIGLANVRRIIGRHGGRTWAEGVVGKGATFFFSLPVVFLPEDV